MTERERRRMTNRIGAPAARHEVHGRTSLRRVAQRERAAGGVVMRDGLIAVVHRPRYDDWSLPKGKLEEGESWEDAALREVEEECGLRCRLGRELPTAAYTVRGRPKRVRWWVMSLVEDLGFEPNAEVDELRWATPAEAARTLRYPGDRDLVGAVAACAGGARGRHHPPRRQPHPPGARGARPGRGRHAARPLRRRPLARASGRPRRRGGHRP